MYAVLIFCVSVAITNLYGYKKNIYTFNPDKISQFLSLKRQILVISGVNILGSPEFCYAIHLIVKKIQVRCLCEEFVFCHF